jgi:hypothetical protein
MWPTWRHTAQYFHIWPFVHSLLYVPPPRRPSPQHSAGHRSSGPSVSRVPSRRPARSRPFCRLHPSPARTRCHLPVSKGGIKSSSQFSSCSDYHNFLAVSRGGREAGGRPRVACGRGKNRWHGPQRGRQAAPNGCIALRTLDPGDRTGRSFPARSEGPAGRERAES